MRPWQADLCLLVLAIFWGATFAVQKESLKYTGPLTLNVWRYTLAALVLGLVFLPRMRKITRREILAGLFLGTFLGLGNIGQMIGLKTVSSGKAGFITGLYLVLVPFLSWAWLKQPLRFSNLFGTFLATVGLGLFSLNEHFGLSPGDLWVLLSAVMFAGHVVGVTALSEGRDVVRVTVVQLLMVGLIALLPATYFETFTLRIPPPLWPYLAYMVLIPSALGFTVHLWAQPKTTPVRAGLIMGTEAIFAALVGWAWAGETLSPKEFFGGGLMFVGIIVVEVLDKRGRNRALTS